MLRFFNRIRKKLLREGVLGKYLLYAAGEILLVVLGILIALQVNTWSEDGQLRVQERLLLTEMQRNLQEDLKLFEQQLHQIQGRQAKIVWLSDALAENRLEVYHDSLSGYFGAVYGVELSTLNTANYEDLKSRGFDLIRDDSLRFQINRFFEEAAFQLAIYDKAEDSNNEVIKPYYLTHFKDLHFLESATPVDFYEIVRDHKYQNLVDYRKINFAANQLTHHHWFIREMKSLIASIDAYLAP